MTISEFIFLDETSMKAAVLHKGILIAKRRHVGHLVFLFQMKDYYVEVYFDKRSRSAVEYRAFNNTNSLAPYLSIIGIDDLLL